MNIGGGNSEGFFGEIEVIVFQIRYVSYIHAGQMHGKPDKVMLSTEDVQSYNNRYNSLLELPEHLNQLLMLLLDIYFLYILHVFILCFAGCNDNDSFRTPR